MNTTWFLVVLVMGPLLAWVCLASAGISLRRLSLPSLIVLLYLVLAYAGLPILYFGLDAYAVSIGVDDRAIIFRMTVCAALALALIGAGALYVSLVFGRDRVPTAIAPVQPATRTEVMCVLGLVAVCVGVFLAYLSQVDTIALLPALQGDAAAAAQARSDMGNSFVGKYWRYRLFFRTGIDFCVVFFLAHYLVTRTRTSLVLCAGVFVAALVTALAATEKSPSAMLLAMAYLGYVYCRGGRYWQPAATYVVPAAVISLLALYIYLTGVSDWTTALGFLAGRVFTGQIAPAYFYLELFPERLDFLWGQSFPNPAGLLPFTQFPLTQYVEQYMAQRMPVDVVGSAPTVFWGEMYANFGFPGVAVGSFAVGAGLAGLNAVLSRPTPSPAIVAAVVSIAAHYSALTMTSLSNFLVDTTLVFIVCVTAAILLVRRRSAESPS